MKMVNLWQKPMRPCLESDSSFISAADSIERTLTIAIQDSYDNSINSGEFLMIKWPTFIDYCDKYSDGPDFITKGNEYIMTDISLPKSDKKLINNWRKAFFGYVVIKRRLAHIDVTTAGIGRLELDYDTLDDVAPEIKISFHDSKLILPKRQKSGEICIRCRKDYPYANKEIGFICWSCKNGY